MTRPFIIQLIYILSTITLSIIVNPFFLLLLVLPAVINFMDLINIDINLYTTLVFGSLYIKTTKRVYTEYGRFYIFIRGSKVHLIQDKIFYLKYIDYCRCESIDNIKPWIKNECEFATKNEREKHELLKGIREWNGCVDVQSDRDKKLSDLIK